jgi:hypothetical protein
VFARIKVLLHLAYFKENRQEASRIQEAEAKMGKIIPDAGFCGIGQSKVPSNFISTSLTQHGQPSKKGGRSSE